MQDNISVIIASVLVILMLTGCSNSNEYEQSIDRYPVRFTVNLTFDSELNGITGFKSFTKPRLGTDILSPSGVLVVTSPHLSGDGIPILYAYDLQCPHERIPSIRVETTDGLTAICPKCKSKFNIIDGYGMALAGNSSKTPLQVYRIDPIRNPYEGKFRIIN